MEALKPAFGVLKPPNSPSCELLALPASLPPILNGELAWSGADFGGKSPFVYELTEADKDEIGAGLVHFKGKNGCFTL